MYKPPTLSKPPTDLEIAENTYTLTASQWMELTSVIEDSTDETDEWYTIRFAEIVRRIRIAKEWTEPVTLKLSYGVYPWLEILRENVEARIFERAEGLLHQEEETPCTCLPSKELSELVGKYLQTNSSRKEAIS